MRLIDADALIAETMENRCADCDRRKGVKRGKITFVYDFGEAPCRACDVGNMIDTLDDAPTVGGWISVKDRLPEEKENPYTQDYQEVLCVLKTRFGTDVRVYKFGKGHFWNGPKEIDRFISHWMPFPELPKEDNND